MEKMVDNAFWKNKVVLVTGHTGFKGSWLTLWLKSMGAKVIGYSLDPNTAPNLYDTLNLESDITSLIGDIRDLSSLNKCFDKHNPEIVFHLAAQALVRSSYQNPVETYSTNVMGTVNILEAARLSQSVRVIVNITTDKTYENKEWVYPYRETDRLGGYDPYSNSQACSELVSSAYRNSFFNIKDYDIHKVGIATVRAGNVIGGGDWSTDRLIPDIIKALSCNEQIVIRNPKSIRPWQHVLEPLSGYLVLAQKLYNQKEATIFSDSWNFGPNDHDVKDVSWIADKLVSLWGGNVIWKTTDLSGPHEAKLLKLDISKAQKELGWTPKLDLSHALNLIVEWYQAFNSGDNMKEYTINQIKKYENLKN